jgi:hypothetical protein
VTWAFRIWRTRCRSSAETAFELDWLFRAPVVHTHADATRGTAVVTLTGTDSRDNTAKPISLTESNQLARMERLLQNAALI